MYPRYLELDACLATGGPAAGGGLPRTAEEQTIASEGIAAFSAESAQALAARCDFGRHRRILDLGGGTSSWLRAILQHHPTITGTLVDRPTVAAIARERTTDLGNRVAIAAGDFLVDEIPAGHDVVLMANVVHHRAPDGNVSLLRRVRDRVAPPGRLLLVDFWMNATHTEPLTAALMSGVFLLNTGSGASCSVEEAREWLAASGWRFVEHFVLSGRRSAIVAEAAA